MKDDHGNRFEDMRVEEGEWEALRVGNDDPLAVWRGLLYALAIMAAFAIVIAVILVLAL